MRGIVPEADVRGKLEMIVGPMHGKLVVKKDQTRKSPPKENVASEALAKV